MTQEYSLELSQTIRLSTSPTRLERTPLHVEFSSGPNYVPSERVEYEDLGDPELFNAIGSRALTHSGHAESWHYPVVDVDGGIELRIARGVQKAILGAYYRGSYAPTSDLRDLLGDHSIELEVFNDVQAKYRSIYDADFEKELVVRALILRSREPIFETYESTTKEHKHLYIQQIFSEEDHKALIKELQNTGVVSEAWAKLVDQEGMGIVRTPWTAKEIHHSSSN